MHFAVSVMHAVADVEQAAAFFESVLGFHERCATHDGIQMSNGALTVRLVPSTPLRPEGILEIELETPDLQETVDTLLQHAGSAVLQEEQRVTLERAEIRLQVPHGVLITLARTFNEDELGILPALPATLTWTPEAEARLKQILRFVPVMFRGLARRRVTERAEQLTRVAGKGAVDQQIALCALVQSTPAFQHQRLREELLSAGIDPVPLFATLQA